MYSDSSELLLNDFSLQVGDTFTFKLITDGSFHQLQVFTIDSVQVNTGEWTQVFSMTTLNPPVLGSGCDDGCAWLAGIGNFCNFLYIEIPPRSCDTVFYNTECFWQNGTYVTGGTYCDFSTGIHSISSSENKLEISPIPVFNISNINLGIQADNVTELFILNSLGQLIKDVNKSQIKDFFINAFEYPPGLYLLFRKTKNDYSSIKFNILH